MNVGTFSLTVLSPFCHPSGPRCRSGRWLEPRSGLVFGIGAVFGFVGGMIGLLVNAPAAKKLGALGARAQAGGRAPTPEEIAEMTILQNRLFNATRLAAPLLIVAAAAMASARY